MGLLNDSIDAGPVRRSWAESHWLWDLYVAGGCVAAICAVFVLNATDVNDTDLARRVGAAAAIVVLFVWYLALGRAIIRTRPPGHRRAWVFVAGVVVLFAVALLLSTNTWAVVPVVYPLLFMSLTLRSALALTAVINVLPLAAVVVTEGLDSDTMPLAIVLTVLALLISPAIGTWITKTVEQSEERAHLLDELAASRAESSRLSRDAGTAAERARLAREIHDTLAQGFTSIVALSQAIESEIDVNPEAARRHIALIADTARENLAEARAMVAALTPSALTAGSLIDAVRRQAARLEQETGIVVTVSAPVSLPTLSTATEVVLLRAVQEGLANVRRHAGASTVVVDIAERDDGVRVVVTDDGIGIADSHTDGYGLRGMRDRVEEAGGQLRIGPADDCGTRLEVEVPA